MYTIIVLKRFNVMKNITFSADKKLIEEARQQAVREHTTLNAKFRSWLEHYVQRQKRAEEAMELITELRSKYSTDGRKFTREEMNER